MTAKYVVDSEVDYTSTTAEDQTLLGQLLTLYSNCL